MLVAKLPGSTYATAATNAGPRNGSSARSPCVSPWSALCAASSTRCSPGSAAGASSRTQRSGCSASRRASAPALDPAFDGRFELARGQDFDPDARHQPATVELAQQRRILVRHALHAHLFPGSAVAERPLAQQAHLARQARDGMPVRVQLRPPEQLEDPGLHSLGDEVLEALRLVVDLVPGIAENLDQEHLQEPVVPNQLQGDLPAFTRQLLAAVAVALDEALGAQAPDHLAHGWRRDAESLGQLARRHGPLVTVQLVQRLQVVLLGPGECASSF